MFPHFGVFPPTRQYHMKIFNSITTDGTRQNSIRVMEIGIGLGVLSIILLQQKKMDHVIRTYISLSTIVCAKDHMQGYDY